MDRQEVQQLLMMIATAYPNFKVENKTQTIDTWLLSLEEYNAQDALTEYKSYVKTSNIDFAPSVSRLIGEIEKLNELAAIDDVTGWDMVRKAISRSAYNSKAEFEKLPEIIQRAVGSANQLFLWATDENYNESVVMSVFQKNYRTIKDRADAERKLPTESKIKLEQLREQNLAIASKDPNVLMLGGVSAVPENLAEPKLEPNLEPNLEPISGTEYVEKLRKDMNW